MFSSFSQSGPGDLNGSVWESTVEGTQHFPDFQEGGATDAFSPFSLGQVTTSQGEEPIEDFQNKWAIPSVQDATPVAPTSAPMRRITSGSSTGSHRRSRPSSRSQRRLRVTLAQAPQISYDQLAGNASMAAVGQYMEMESALPVTHAFYPGLTSAGFSPDALAYGPSMAHALQPHVNPTCTQMDLEPGLTCQSPSHSWDSASSTGLARTPSPGAVDEAWIAPQLVSSPTDTTGCSPIFHGQSPRLSRKYGAHLPLEGPMSGLHPNGFPDEFSLPPAFAATRISGTEVESPRDHEWYKAGPRADGLYHCPLEGQENCNHKPEKLKCNYDKFVDSHLRPYRCKQEACENLQFSSTACLLRHEREAHGMHGHGAKPYLCTYEGCDRAQPGNGFPRHWNLKDHMKRVHNDVAPAQSSYAAGNSPPSSSSSQAQAAKMRKRKKDDVTAISAGVRKSSSKGPTSAPTASKVEKRLAEAAERWYAHQQRLSDVLSGFTQPDDPLMLQRLRDAQEQLEAMTKISTGLAQKKPMKA
ncbi:hypothetical protein PpBr36_00346 [Pyricularia pennisetigena]|uniref:hypothetical protein n=1 Tax=Pyricularia pennisetigena TaxID=1578925 RepID=UPI00114E61B0|nr:hypothetical protein PpBr36_00346 [Pyricularia pennisetigena]TLS28995.1 hypothetical protein PpBr36_00346 [Pyricularia pennisetigena]